MTLPQRSPGEMAQALTPSLTELINNPLYSDVPSDPALSPRDRSLATLGAVVALYRSDELPAQLLRAKPTEASSDLVKSGCGAKGGAKGTRTPDPLLAK
jgi:alkylhydroperoxidase/carboxymuconolactone decarboxylase family protein YurZ